MPVTLECLCGGGGETPCSLVALDFVTTGWFVGELGFFGFNVTNGPGGSTFFVNGNGTVGLSPIGDWLAAMEGVGITLGVGRSTSSDVFATAGGEFYILATYLCVNPDGVESTETTISTYRGGDEVRCPDNGMGAVFGSSVAGQWWHSRPLSDCTFISVVTSGGFTAPPTIPLKSGTGSGEWCLCASGGTTFIDSEGHEFAPIYHFEIVSGVLPSGQVLDPDTGCITGEADGVDPGSDSITFRVLDVRSEDGAFADVTCGVILPGCTGPTVEPVGNSFL